MLKQSRSIISLQSGKGDFPVYRGVSRQYGNGLGSIFKAALRTVIPILKPVAKASLTSKFREFMSPAIIVYYLNEKK